MEIDIYECLHSLAHVHNVQFLRAILSCRINGRHFSALQDSNLSNVFCVAPIGFPVTRIRIRICFGHRWPRAAKPCVYILDLDSDCEIGFNGITRREFFSILFILADPHARLRMWIARASQTQPEPGLSSPTRCASPASCQQCSAWADLSLWSCMYRSVNTKWAEYEHFPAASRLAFGDGGRGRSQDLNIARQRGRLKVLNGLNEQLASQSSLSWKTWGEKNNVRKPQFRQQVWTLSYHISRTKRRSSPNAAT